MSQRKGWVQIPLSGDPAIQEINWTRSSGAAQSVFYEGSFEDMEARATELQEDYDSIRVSRVRGKGGWCRVDAAQAGDAITEIHEVHGSSLTQDKIFNSIQKKLFTDGGEDATTMAKIAVEVRKALSGGQTYSDMTGAVADIWNNSVAFDFADELFQYGEQFLNLQYSYEHTIVVAERIFAQTPSIIPGYANLFKYVNQIHTETQLRTAESIPASFALPPKVVDNSATAEWLKQAPTSSLTVGQKREIKVMYLFADKWLTGDYVAR